jgi:hypothetical protein
MKTISKNRLRYYSVLLLLALSIMALLDLRLQLTPVLADGGCTVVVTEDGATCTNGGSRAGGGANDGSSSSDNSSSGSSTNDGRNGDSRNNGQGGTCTPGTYAERHLSVPPGSLNLPNGSIIYTMPNGSTVNGAQAPAGMCTTVSQWVDTCTGEASGGTQGPIANSNGLLTLSACPNYSAQSPNPCDKFIVSSSGVTCASDFVDGSSFPASRWQLTVHTPFPGAEIHTRPYPVSLVNWDTVMRVMSLGTSSNTGRLGYAAWGGGDDDEPAPGDWKDITLRLEIKPVADWAEVFLENIGLIRMRLGELHTFQWNLPSHPAAGRGPLSGQVGQLEELQPDVPLYTNWTRAPYMVYCTISYYEWRSTCVSGASEDGGYDCGKNSYGYLTGHREWHWKRASKTTVITPSVAINQVPANMLADLNGDGRPDAYWGRLSFIRRMDDAGSVTNPQWAHSYSWGPVWYWAVREGQGQIGWPGIPAQ